MNVTPSSSALIAATGISKSYASEITNGKRDPSRPLAIFIFRKIGWRHPIIADLTEKQMTMLEEIEPWSQAA